VTFASATVPGIVKICIGTNTLLPSPDTEFVGVAHRTSVNRHYRKYLELLGNGEWKLVPVQDITPTGTDARGISMSKDPAGPFSRGRRGTRGGRNGRTIRGAGGVHDAGGVDRHAARRRRLLG